MLEMECRMGLFLLHFRPENENTNWPTQTFCAFITLSDISIDKWPFSMDWWFYYVPHQRGGGHIVFGADPVGVGVGVSVALSCLHDISWTGVWILTKFTRM